MEELTEYGIENVPVVQSLGDQVNDLWMIINTVNEVLRVTVTSVSHILIVLRVNGPTR